MPFTMGPTGERIRWRINRSNLVGLHETSLGKIPGEAVRSDLFLTAPDLWFGDPQAVESLD